MRKVLLFLQILLMGVFIVGCGKNAQRSESQIISDLSNSDSFWSMIFQYEEEKAKDLYTITSFKLLDREIVKSGGKYNEREEIYAGTVSMKSTYATYTGDIILEYGAEGKDELALQRISQTVLGKFDILSQPDEALMKEEFEKKYTVQYEVLTQESEQNYGDYDSYEDRDYDAYEEHMRRYDRDTPRTLIEVKATEIPDKPGLCEVCYVYQYEKGTYCTVTQTDYDLWAFQYGLWRQTQESREGISEYSYHDLPPITESEIAKAVNTVLSKEIGTYQSGSAVFKSQDGDQTHIEMSSCVIQSVDPVLYDTSPMSVTFSASWGEEDRPEWKIKGVKLHGSPKLNIKGTYRVPHSSSVWEHNTEEHKEAEITIEPDTTITNEGQLILVNNVTVNGKEYKSMFSAKSMRNGFSDALQDKIDAEYMLYTYDTKIREWYFYFDKELKPIVYLSFD